MCRSTSPHSSSCGRHWADIKLGLIADIDKDFGVYEGTVFKSGLFAAWLAAEGIEWPRTTTGRLQLDQDTFRDMAKTYPKLDPLKELRHALGEMRLEEIAVGPDGRNRTMLSPFGARTGRNTPSNTRFIFGPAVWLRGLIKPPAGRALAYVDWCSQEVAIAAALSGTRASAMRSSPATRTWRSPSGRGWCRRTRPRQATPHMREVCKTVVLGTNYGMGAQTLAYRTGLSMIEAQDVLRKLAAAFPTFWEWAEHVIDVGILTGRLSTVFGWPIHVTDNARPTALRNYPMQANGAEMLRLACCLATEQGIEVCAPIHDALLIEGDAARSTTWWPPPGRPWQRRRVMSLGTWRSVPTCPSSRTRTGIPTHAGKKMWERVTERLASTCGF